MNPPRNEAAVRPGDWRAPRRHLPALIAAAGFGTCLGVALLRGPDLYRGLLGLAVLAVLCGIAIHDVETRRAPNRIVFPALGLFALAVLPLGSDLAIQALAGAALTFVIFALVAAAGRGAMGLGDVKVSAICGLAVGLQGVFWLIALTFGIALVVAVPLVMLRVYRMRDTIAFTPFLAAGTALVLCLGHSYLWP